MLTPEASTFYVRVQQDISPSDRHASLGIPVHSRLLELLVRQCMYPGKVSHCSCLFRCTLSKPADELPATDPSCSEITEGDFGVFREGGAVCRYACHTLRCLDSCVPLPSEMFLPVFTTLCEWIISALSCRWGSLSVYTFSVTALSCWSQLLPLYLLMGWILQTGPGGLSLRRYCTLWYAWLGMPRNTSPKQMSGYTLHITYLASHSLCLTNCLPKRHFGYIAPP